MLLSYLAKLVVRRGDGQPLEAYDHAELAAQRERLARFAGVVEWLDRFKFRDWKEDFETLDELLKRQTILELSSETFPDELNLAQVKLNIPVHTLFSTG